MITEQATTLTTSDVRYWRTKFQTVNSLNFYMCVWHNIQNINKKTRKETQLKLYKGMDVQMLTYGCQYSNTAV
jgi:hypothetical protein